MEMTQKNIIPINSMMVTTTIKMIEILDMTTIKMIEVLNMTILNDDRDPRCDDYDKDERSSCGYDVDDDRDPVSISSTV